jgi:hypothetical protein
MEEFAGPQWNYPNRFTSVIEFTFSAPTSREAQLEKDTIIDILRLCKLGSIQIEQEIISPHTIFQPHSFNRLPYSNSASFTYEVSPDEKDTLAAFFDMLKPILTKLKVMEENHLHIAFQRYKDATLQKLTYENRITTAITCLEALYLVENAELTHRLSQRVARLMQIVGATKNALDTYNDIKNAYKIRSLYTHGSKSKNIPNLNQLTKTILSFARISIIVFMQIATTSKEKAQIIKYLDQSLLDENTHIKLKNIVSGIENHILID